jgi:hypothetical protein
MDPDSPARGSLTGYSAVRPAGWRWLLVATGIAVGVLVSPRARAGDEEVERCTEAPEVCGKRAFQEGIAAYGAGQYSRALTYFRTAQAIRPHPSILFNVALAEARVGLVIEALGHLEEVFSDPQTPMDLLSAAREERDRLSAEVATVSVGSDAAELFVDGTQPEGKPPLMRVNPGRHQVRVVLRGKTVVDRAVALKPGEHMNVALAEASPEPVAPKPIVPESKPPPVAPAPPGNRGLVPWWAVAGGGVTLVLGGAALVSQLEASRAFDQYKRDLPNLTQAEAQRRRDQGRSMDTRTSWLFGGAVVVGVATAGLAIFWTDWSTRKPGVALGVGLDAVTVHGRF